MMPVASSLTFNVRLLHIVSVMVHGASKTHELGAITGGQAKQSQRPGWPHLLRLVQQSRARP